MKIKQIFENVNEVGNPRAAALLTARRVLNSLNSFISDVSSGQFQGMTVQALTKLLGQYQMDVQKALKAIEAIREGRETEEDVKLILEFEQSKLGQKIQQLNEGK